jgi:hypothetical protein
MGEIAEMMLDGTMCAGCGEWLHDGNDGDGFPGYCSGCAPDYDDDQPRVVTMKRIHKELKFSQKTPEQQWQSTIDKTCDKIVREMGGIKMTKKTRKRMIYEMHELLKGFLNVDGVIVHKKFEAK